MKSNDSDAGSNRPAHLFGLLALLVSLLFGVACRDEVDHTETDVSFELEEQCMLFGDPRCYDGTLAAPHSEWGPADEALFEKHRLLYQPPCVDSDGLGRHSLSLCGSEPSETNLYAHCTSPEEAPDGSEPCIWWILGYPAEDREGICSYTVVCAPESLLAELGWPEDQGFDFHQNCGFDVCDQSTWPDR